MTPFLGNVYRDDAFGGGKPVTIGLGSIVLPLQLTELRVGDTLCLTLRSQPYPEGLLDAVEEDRRMDVSVVLTQEAPHFPLAFQPEHVDVKVEPGYAAHCQCHAFSDKVAFFASVPPSCCQHWEQLRPTESGHHYTASTDGLLACLRRSFVSRRRRLIWLR